MPWNWQLAHWPNFTYDPALIQSQERQFLLNLGTTTGFLKTLVKEDYQQFIVEILSQEGSDSSKIEGEILDRESLQSSIRRHFGLQDDHKRKERKEQGMADLLCSAYESYQTPLTHEILWKWHELLFHGHHHLDSTGCYRNHQDPMQIISRRYDKPTVFFEAPPSDQVMREMERYIAWYNKIGSQGTLLGNAAIAHIYFESIHPFEDGNGRIGRALIEKLFSMQLERPVLIAVSKILEMRKKEYYEALGSCNKNLDANHWVAFFANAALEALNESTKLLRFLIQKSKLLNALKDKINDRQEKVLLRIFEQGLQGFQGGLSAENYIAITKASRATTTRDLAQLVALGALTKTGELRHTRYWLNLPDLNM